MKKDTWMLLILQVLQLIVNMLMEISITMETPHKHLWAYAVGLSDNNNNSCCNCPCETLPGRPAPSFVGNDYYWEPKVTNQTHCP